MSTRINPHTPQQAAIDSGPTRTDDTIVSQKSPANEHIRLPLIRGSVDRHAAERGRSDRRLPWALPKMISLATTARDVALAYLRPGPGPAAGPRADAGMSALEKFPVEVLRAIAETPGVATALVATSRTLERKLADVATGSFIDQRAESVQAPPRPVPSLLGAATSMFLRQSPSPAAPPGFDPDMMQAFALSTDSHTARDGERLAREAIDLLGSEADLLDRGGSNALGLPEGPEKQAALRTAETLFKASGLNDPMTGAPPKLTGPRAAPPTALIERLWLDSGSISETAILGHARDADGHGGAGKLGIPP